MFLGYRAIDETVRIPFQFVNTAGQEAVATNLAVSVFEENNNVAIFGPAAPNVVDSTNYKGLYRLDLTLSTAAGFEEGKQYYVRAKGDIDGVTPATIVGYFVIDSMRANVDLISTAMLISIAAVVLGGVPGNYGPSSVAGYIEKLKHVICNRSLIDENTNTLTHYADDGTTPSRVFDLKDELGNPTVDEPFERIPQ